MDDGSAVSLQALHFSVNGVEPEAVEAPAAAPEPEPEESGTDSSDEEGVERGNNDFVLPDSAVWMPTPPPDRTEEERFDAIVARHHAAIVAPEIHWQSGTVRTRGAALRKAKEEAFHAAARAAARKFLGMDP